MKTFKSLLIFVAFIAAASQWGRAQEPSVRVEQESLKGPRELQEQTKSAVVRDYLESWQSFRSALDQNRSDLLGKDFVGTAKDKLTETIEQQAALGIHTRYRDLSHDLQIVFYSPEGLSVEMTDAVAYDVQVIDHDKVSTTQRVIARYIVVMTPSEVSWRVRVLQALPN
jgi:hypothetical protein